MKSGKCPNCGEESVYRKDRGIQVGENRHGMYIQTTDTNRPMPFDAYICTNCGKLELFVTDAGKLGEVGRTWERVR